MSYRKWTLRLKVMGSLGASWPLGAALFSVGLGALVGIGGYTFVYAEGLSYFKTDPRACVNCHIMQPQYDGWQKSGHHTVAVCVDCHLPQEFVHKYLVKTENGWRHGKMFTTGNFQQPIEVKPAGQMVLQANCVRCHADLTADMRAANQAHSTNQSHSGEIQCVKCHSDVGHGGRSGIGGPLRPDELSALSK